MYNVSIFVCTEMGNAEGPSHKISRRPRRSCIMIKISPGSIEVEYPAASLPDPRDRLRDNYRHFPDASQLMQPHVNCRRVNTNCYYVLI